MSGYEAPGVGIIYSSIPFVGAKKLEIVLHGGPGPTPGTKEAVDQGCTCPGDVGDLDNYGREGGHTVNELCSLHGKEARRKLAGDIRKEKNGDFRWLL